MGFIFTAHGLITNNTARVMFEVTRSDTYIFSYYKLGTEKISMEYDVKAGRPCVIQLEQLEKGSSYFYSFFDPVTNDIINDSFTTLNTNFVMISPSHEIHEETLDDSQDIFQNQHNDKQDITQDKIKLGTETDLNYNNQTHIYVNYKLPLDLIQHDYKKMNVEDVEHVKNLLRNVYRKNWNKLSGSNIMIANCPHTKNPVLNECIKEVYDEFQRGLRINNHTSITDYFMVQYGKIGYIVLNQLGEEQLTFVQNTLGRLVVDQWIIVSPVGLFTKRTKKLASTLLSLFPNKLPLFVSTDSTSKIIFIKKNNKTIGYQINMCDGGCKESNGCKRKCGERGGSKALKKINQYCFKTDHVVNQTVTVDITKNNDNTLIEINSLNVAPYQLTI